MDYKQLQPQYPHIRSLLNARLESCVHSHEVKANYELCIVTKQQEQHDSGCQASTLQPFKCKTNNHN